MTQKELPRRWRFQRRPTDEIEIGLKSPIIREFGNLALVLGCGLADLIEDKWRIWSLPGEPPDPESLWRAGRLSVAPRRSEYTRAVERRASVL